MALPYQSPLITLHDALADIYNHPDIAERSVLIEALRSDIPNLDALLAQSDRGQDLEYRWQGLSNDAILFPMSWRLSKPELAVGLHNWQKRPLVFLLDEDLFEASVGDRAQGPEWAAFILAEWMAYYSNAMCQDPHIRGWIEPDHNSAARLERMKTLAYHERVEHYLIQMLGINHRNDNWTKLVGKTSALVSLKTLYNTIVPTMKTVARTSTHEESVLALTRVPPDGKFIEMIKRIKLLKKHMRNKTVPVDGAWLNRAQVWEAVREAGQLRAFLLAAERAGAFRDKARKVDDTLMVPSTLAWLEAETTGSADQCAKASAALVAYFQGVENKAEMTQVMSVIMLWGKSDLLNSTPVSHAINQRIQMLNYTIKDVVPLLERMHNRYDLKISFLLDLLGPQSPQNIADLWHNLNQSCAVAMLVDITHVVAEHDPGVLDTLTDRGFQHLIRASQAGSSRNWNGKAGKALEARGLLIANSTEQLALWDMATASRKNTVAEHVIIGFLSSATGDALQETIMTRNNSRDAVNLVRLATRLSDTGRVANEIFKGNDHDLFIIGRLLGYDTNNDKDQALAAMDDKTKRHLLMALAYDTMIDRREERECDNRSLKPVNLRKNIAFDIIEKMPALPPERLGSRDGLVVMGLAKQGDLLTWRTAMEILMPFISAPRPPLDQSTQDIVTAGPKIHQEEDLVDLSAEVIKQRIAQMGTPGCQSEHQATTMPSFIGRLIKRMGRDYFSKPALMDEKDIAVALAGEIQHKINSGQWFSGCKPVVEVHAENKIAEGDKVRGIKPR